MATKNAEAGGKRKASSNEKPGSKNAAKKPKLDAARKPFRDEDMMDADGGSSSDFSDPDDGGAKLTPPKEKKSFEKKNGKNVDKPRANGNAPPGKTFERGANSRESHAKQKQLAQERKAAKPLADDVARTKKLWERLRRKSHVPKEERQQLVDELFEIISGRVSDFVLKHDAVRAVQTAIKYATPTQRKQIAKELQGTYARLAESRYAKFLIGKLLVQNDDDIRDIITPEFYGKVRKLINHPEASWILDDVYRGVATKEQKAVLLREWYGPEFALFGATPADPGSHQAADLSEILEHEPSKKGPVMEHLMGMINALIQKKMTGFTMLHDAMLQYFLNLKVGSDEQKEFLEVVKEDEGGDLLKNMAFTKSGARLVCLLMAHGNAKDRKQLLKTYKETFQLMCGDPNGHLIILAAYDLIDDTVLTSKTILPEILGKNEQKEVENIIFCANDLNARTTVLYLFDGASKALFPASHSTDLQVLEELHEIRKTTSKKNGETRRKELIAAASPQLLAAISAAPDNLVSTSFGCQFVTDVLLAAKGDKTRALQAIAATAAGEPELAPEETYPPPRPHISQTSFGGKMFKTLIAGGRFDKASGKIQPVDPPLDFANILYPNIKSHLVSWATGPSSFVPLALLEADDFSQAAELREMLTQNKKDLAKAAKEETPEQKARRGAVEQEQDTAGKPAKKGKKKPLKQERTIGNTGSKLLLGKL